jgi:hypothetical protein
LTDASLRLRIGETPVDIVSYPYQLLTRPIAGPEGVAVASVRDLAMRFPRSVGQLSYATFVILWASRSFSAGVM